MKLYDYFRSTASYRIRIALNYKNIAYQKQDIQLIDIDGKKAEQNSIIYKKINPQGLVPSLLIDLDNANETAILSQSVAILEYLEEEYPKPNILPKNNLDRAYIRQLVNIIACDMHPLNNLRVLQYLKQDIKISEDQKLEWYHHWLDLGFSAFNELLQIHNSNGKYCFKDSVSMADICLIPQVYNANRFEFDLSKYELINSINNHCLKLNCFDLAKP
tara:strand:+ start:8839 stop:9489 length:651 start_codon:yes stop_codon:yes gene_type:complete